MQPNLKKFLILLILIIIVGLAYYLINYFQVSLPGQSLPEGKSGEEEPALCSEFPEVEGEVSCQGAIEIALRDYPGEVQKIEKTKASLPLGILPEVEMAEREVWLLTVALTEPVTFEGDERDYETIDLFVIRDSGELEINKLMSQEP